jgi:hypothetical protein
MFGLGAGFNSINNLPQTLKEPNPSGMLCCAVGFIVFNSLKDCGAFMFGTKQSKKKRKKKKKYVKYEGTTNLQNAQHSNSNSTVKHPTRLESSATVLSLPEIL